VNKDYLDILRTFLDCEVEFLVVGAYAVGSHGYVRTTGDLDIWVNPTEENAARVWKALAIFGAPRSRVIEEDFATDDVVYQMGVAPQRIDILTSVTGLTFAPCIARSSTAEFNGISVRTLSLADLIENKTQTGRSKDKLDVLELQRIRDRKK
jgi:hypothetical protein